MFAGRFSGKRDLKNRVGENFGKSVWGVLWGRVGKLGTDFIPVRLIYIMCKTGRRHLTEKVGEG